MGLEGATRYSCAGDDIELELDVASGRRSRRSTKVPSSMANQSQQQQQQQQQQLQTAYRSYEFRPFTRESLANIKKRRAKASEQIKSLRATSNGRPSSACIHSAARSSPRAEASRPSCLANQSGNEQLANEPDPYLASGLQLPPILIRQLPSELIGKPIEDIDPYYADRETFLIISRGHELNRFNAGKALYLFGPFHPIRRVVLCILVSPIFNLLVILTILCNCIIMTLNGSDTEEKTEIFFTIVYTTEMCLKVLARGFIMDDFSYLKDPWNWLDFTVIIMAYITIVVEDLGNLSVMRTFRVLRALKTVAIIPGMKTIVGAVIDSVKNLKDVVVLTLFSLSVFSLVGLQIYMGQLTQKCILDGHTNMTDPEWFDWCSNSSNWRPDPDSEIYGAYRLCGNSTGAQSCPPGHTCLQGFGPNPDYGYTNFDTFGWALIASFRLMTQDYWEGLYVQILKTCGSWHILFFIVSIFLGSIYLMNLILAIVAMSYNELQRRAEEEEEAAAEEEAQFLDSCRLMELQGRDNRSSYQPSLQLGFVGQSLVAGLFGGSMLGHSQTTMAGGARSVREESLATSQLRARRRSSGLASVDLSGRSRSLCVQPASVLAMMEVERRKSATTYHLRPGWQQQQQQQSVSPVAGLSQHSLSGNSSNFSCPPRDSHKGETPTDKAGQQQTSAQQQQSQSGSPTRFLAQTIKRAASFKVSRSSKSLTDGFATARGYGRAGGRSPKSAAAAVAISSSKTRSPRPIQAARIRIISCDEPPDQPPDASCSSPHAQDGESLVNKRWQLEQTFDRTHLAPFSAGDSNRCLSHCQSVLAISQQPSICLQRRSSGSESQLLSNQLSQATAFKPVATTTSTTDTNTTSPNSKNRLGSLKKVNSERQIMGNLQLPGATAPYHGSRLHASSMNHLSVVNFQEFSQTTTQVASGSPDLSNEQASTVITRQPSLKLRPSQADLSAPVAAVLSDGSSVTSNPWSTVDLQATPRHGRSQSRASVIFKPSTASSMGQHQVRLGSGLQQRSAGARKMSTTRRASDWSRMSMSTNTDIRRLLRIWAHTNPYQWAGGRDHSIGSLESRNLQLLQQQHHLRQQHQHQQYSPVPSQADQNSPRPSINSTRQAYELISAMNRRRSRVIQPYERRYAVRPPLDDDDGDQDDYMLDDMDDMSVSFRDKCLAYCLNGLDILCIWECCGAWIRVQRLIALLVFDPFTELFIILCIVINTLFMALDNEDADPYWRVIFEKGNYFFTATFAVEASMKIMALSPKFYFREGWNVFDSIIVGLSLLELGLEGVYGLSVLRSFRLLRVFKLAKSWPTLNLLISIMGKAMGDLGNLTFVLAIIVFIFAVMGMQLFGNKYVAANFPSGELPRWNFTDFMHSFMIVFRILCAEWIEPMWDCLLVGGWPCIPFFLIAVTVGNLVVLNLFLALLLASFGASNLSSPQSDNVDTAKLKQAIERFTRFGQWMKFNLMRLINSILGFLPIDKLKFRRKTKRNIKQGDFASAASAIVAISRTERRKLIEAKTELLRNKIKGRPDHNEPAENLSQLAQGQTKRGKSRWVAAIAATTSGGGGGGNHAATGGMAIPIIIQQGDDQESQHEPALSAPSSPKLHQQAQVGFCFQVEDAQQQQQKHQQQQEQQQLHWASQSQRSQPQTPTSSCGPMHPIREDSKESSPEITEQTIATGSMPETTVSQQDQPASKQVPKSAISEIVVAVEQPIAQQVAIVEDEPVKNPGGFNQSNINYHELDEEDERALQHVESYLEKCICLGIVCLKWFLFRKFIRSIVEHRYFDQGILLLIVISSGTLALEDKHLNERPRLKQTLDILDTIFTLIFSLEMVFKWIAFGIRRYFSNLWSWLDFVIVLVGVINLMASIFGSGKIQALKTMRTLRAMRGLRPLRALQRFQGMRVVVNALIQAIPSIFNVLLVCLIFWLIFSIMGVQMFGGKFWRCTDKDTGELVGPEIAENRNECLANNLTWSNPQINFDNVLNAYLALFQVATFKGWIDIMDSAANSRGRDEQPIREANIYMYFYFVFFVIFGSFFTLNLFIGVIIDNFNEQKKKTGGSLEIFMTEDQKKYYHAMKKMKSKRPIKAITRPKFKFQAHIFDITTSKKFDMTIMIIIVVNMFVMALEHYGQSQEFSLVLERLNLIFIALFTLECLCKIFAMRHFYFREPWNIFDFIVVGLSILGVLMKEYVAKYLVSPTLLRVVRVVKVGRVLRLVKGAKGIRTLLFALAMSLPALFNICLLLFLVMFIYAIFGMSFFMNVRKRNGLDETFNFETFTSSIIVLFEMSTSAGWDIVLDPLMDEENDCQKPDPAQNIEGTCGNRAIAVIYLVSYVIVTFLIIINMYIAVILENYSQATEDVQEGLTDDDYEMYYEIWQKFDPDGTQFLAYERLSDFLDALELPLRIEKPNELAIVVLDINIYENNMCYCVDILNALTKYFFTRKGLEIKVDENLQQFQSFMLNETSFQKITTTFMLKRQHYSALIIQNAWRKFRENVGRQKRLRMDAS